ncbi:AAA family ATPase, partial [Aminipila sp.]|uniref:AAA family ATPase n=1 Tax=Aminipila sp. TaxID=2060095 RepID=UPI00289EFC7C
YLYEFNINPEKKIDDFSKGMKNKLMLAVALSHNPKLLILDEVTSGLDPIIRDDILLVLKDYVSKTTASVLFSTHVTSDLDKIADEVAFLHKGNLIFHETTEALKNQFKLIRCSADQYKALPKENIERVLVREGKFVALIKKDITGSLSDLVSIPSIDDIMLLHIKGETVL